MMRLLLGLTLSSALLIAGCAVPGSGPAPPAKSSPAVPDLLAYRLGIGDRVRIDVYGEGDLSLEGIVDATGQINYPLLGSIPALKKTAVELQNLIASKLANGYLINPDVRVNVTHYRPFYIIGQIRRPGAYPYVNGLTVEKALALAGGLTELGSTRRIYLLQEDSSVEKRRRAELDTLVLPGDTLLIEEGLF